MKYFVVEERDKEWGSNTYNSNNITLVQDWLKCAFICVYNMICMNQYFWQVRNMKLKETPQFIHLIKLYVFIFCQNYTNLQKLPPPPPCIRPVHEAYCPHHAITFRSSQILKTTSSSTPCRHLIFLMRKKNLPDFL